MTFNISGRDAKGSPAHEALWILRDGDDLCDCYTFYASSQGADTFVASLAALKELFRWPAQQRPSQHA